MHESSHKSVKKTTKKSIAERVASDISESSPSKKGKTPLAKQAKRYKKSSEQWREKAVNNSSKVIAQTKTITETRQRTERFKKQNKDLKIQIENLTSDFDQSIKNNAEKSKQLLLAETEVINLQIKLKKVFEELAKGVGND